MCGSVACAETSVVFGVFSSLLLHGVFVASALAGWWHREEGLASSRVAEPLTVMLWPSSRGADSAPPPSLISAEQAAPATSRLVAKRSAVESVLPLIRGERRPLVPADGGATRPSPPLSTDARPAAVPGVARDGGEVGVTPVADIPDRRVVVNASTGGGEKEESGTWRETFNASLAQRKRYPSQARRMRLQGVVEVHAAFSSDGTLQELQVALSSGHASLDAAALQLVREVADVARHVAVPGRAQRLTIPLVYSLLTDNPRGRGD